MTDPLPGSFASEIDSVLTRSSADEPSKHLYNLIQTFLDLNWS